MNKNIFKTIILVAIFLFVATALATAPRYLVRGTDDHPTVVDAAVKLEWQSGHSHEGRLAWNEALAWCEGLDYAGNTDWRLPSVRELVSIVDESQVDEPSINTVFFDSFLPGAYWTSTTARRFPDQAYVVHFDDVNSTDGRGGLDGQQKTSSYYTICVRTSDL